MKFSFSDVRLVSNTCKPYNCMSVKVIRYCLTPKLPRYSIQPPVDSWFGTPIAYTPDYPEDANLINQS